jgi:bifunctional UDP-N-acetylglucosamine pyrophosphorylase/glucosamine-1-phosphate N-acetyltransferase
MPDPPSAASNPHRHVIVLAAGLGTRLKSKRAKVLHRLCGKPLILHVLDKLKPLGAATTLVVIGHEAEAVKHLLEGEQVEFVLQEERLGTGHALLCAASQCEGLSGSLLVVYGDIPLIGSDTLAGMFDALEREDADEVVLTAEYEQPFGYGRIIRDSGGAAIDIVEEKDATPEQRAVREINTGIVCFNIPALLRGLPHLSPQNQAGEYYLTDMLRIIRRSGGKVVTTLSGNPDETWGVNTREELAAVEGRLRAELARKWMLAGVTILNPASVLIDPDVVIGSDTTIYPGVCLEGKTSIGEGCTIYGYCHLQDSVLGDNVVVDHCSVVRRSSIGAGTRVGPFAHVREHSAIACNARIGNFVEVKKSTVQDGAKAAHLAYLGDAEVGKNVNIGAGAITCNYDGVHKHKTVIEDDAFIGSDSQLIAPVAIRKGAYVAAGSTITKDVPEYSLGVTRGRQINRAGWALKKAKAREARRKEEGG